MTVNAGQCSSVMMELFSLCLRSKGHSQQRTAWTPSQGRAWPVGFFSLGTPPSYKLFHKTSPAPGLFRPPTISYLFPPCLSPTLTYKIFEDQTSSVSCWCPQHLGHCLAQNICLWTQYFWMKRGS